MVLTQLSSDILSDLSTRRVKGGYGVKHIWKLCINTHLADRSSGTDSLVSITHEKPRQLFKPLYSFAFLARDGDDNEHIFSYTNIWPASVYHIWLQIICIKRDAEVLRPLDFSRSFPRRLDLFHVPSKDFHFVKR